MLELSGSSRWPVLFGLWFDAETSGGYEMARFKTPKQDFRGWTEWIWPKVKYKFSCCDCGLVHDMRIQVFQVEDSARGQFVTTGNASRRAFRAGFKVRRNERSTALIRRHAKRQAGSGG